MSDSDGDLPNLVELQRQWMSLPGWAGSTIDLPSPKTPSGILCGGSPSTVPSTLGKTAPRSFMYVDHVENNIIHVTCGYVSTSS